MRRPIILPSSTSRAAKSVAVGSVANSSGTVGVALCSGIFRRVQMFKGRHFDRSVMLLCVRWYRRFHGDGGKRGLQRIHDGEREFSLTLVRAKSSPQGQEILGRGRAARGGRPPGRPNSGLSPATCLRLPVRCGRRTRTRRTSAGCRKASSTSWGTRSEGCILREPARPAWRSGHRRKASGALWRISTRSPTEGVHGKRPQCWWAS